MVLSRMHLFICPKFIDNELKFNPCPRLTCIFYHVKHLAIKMEVLAFRLCGELNLLKWCPEILNNFTKETSIIDTYLIFSGS